MSEASNIKAELTQSLKALHLPTIRQSYEEVARQAEREALSYERYLHELVERECEERRQPGADDQQGETDERKRQPAIPVKRAVKEFGVPVDPEP